MGFGLRVILPTVQTGHDFSRFAGVGFPAFSSTEPVTKSLGLEHRPAGLARFLWSILNVESLSCPLLFGFVGTLRGTGNCSLVRIELDPTDNTVFRREFLWCIPLIPPLDTALFAAGNGLPVCLEDLLTDDTALGINRPILGLLML